MIASWPRDFLQHILLLTSQILMRILDYLMKMRGNEKGLHLPRLLCSVGEVNLDTTSNLVQKNASFMVTRDSSFAIMMESCTNQHLMSGRKTTIKSK